MSITRPRSGPRVGARRCGGPAAGCCEVRTWDSRYGGGSWRAASLPSCLADKAAALLRGRYENGVGNQLFSVTGQLARPDGRTAFDAGDDQAAQRHFIQALRLARAGGQGHWVLTCWPQWRCRRCCAGTPLRRRTWRREHTHAQAPGSTAVRGFARPIEARVHAHTGNERSASLSLAAAEQLCDRARRAPDTPRWIGFFSQARIVTDTVEDYRDLHRPQVALRWDAMTALPANRCTRCQACGRPSQLIVSTANSKRAWQSAGTQWMSSARSSHNEQQNICAPTPRICHIGGLCPMRSNS